jgi:hypothetical protein
LAGITGLIFNGFFGTTDVISLDGVNTTILGGFLDHNYKQLYIQLAYICACCGYVFVVTAAIAKIFCLTPGLNLRASDHAELIGIDDDQVRSFICESRRIELLLIWCSGRSGNLSKISLKSDEHMTSGPRQELVLRSRKTRAVMACIII